MNRDYFCDIISDQLFYYTNKIVLFVILLAIKYTNLRENQLQRLIAQVVCTS